jgi:hypothetical protein
MHGLGETSNSSFNMSEDNTALDLPTRSLTQLSSARIPQQELSDDHQQTHGVSQGWVRKHKRESVTDQSSS